MSAERTVAPETNVLSDFEKRVDTVFWKMRGSSERLDQVIEARTQTVKELVQYRCISQDEGMKLAQDYYAELQHLFFNIEREE